MAKSDSDPSGTQRDELAPYDERLSLPSPHEDYEDEIDRLFRWADEHGEDLTALRAESMGEI